MTPPYQYMPIAVKEGEIRLMNLMPGEFHDELRAQFWPANLPLEVPPREKLDLGPLQKTLPAGWRVAETVDSNLIFVHQRDERASWTHPDPNIIYDEGDWRPARKTPADRPVFEALSYCWGPEQPEEALAIEPGIVPPERPEPSGSSPSGAAPTTSGDGASETQHEYLHIRPNLASALRHLRHKTDVRTLWVDAVCINQKNLPERGRHVARMGSLYEQASRVVVWLGPEADDSSEALDAMEYIGKQMELLDSVSLPSPGSEYPGWVRLLEVDEPTLAKVKKLMARPWFQRLWIWQEIVLGQEGTKVQCGFKILSWYHLRRAIVLFREADLPDARMRDGLMANPLMYLPYCTVPYARAWDGWSGLIHGTSRALCHDPRDRVYSLLGLCDPRLARKIEPDYTLPFTQIFIDFFAAFLDEYKSLMLMRFCDLSTRKLEAPTWVPDLCIILLRSTQLTFASGNTCAAAAVIKDGTVLRALGVQTCVVQAVSDRQIDGLPTMAEGFRALKDWHALGRKHAAEKEFPLAFFSAAFFGWVLERSLNQSVGYLRLSSEYAADFQRLLGEAGGDPPEETLAPSLLMQQFMRWDRHHAFICTDDGLMGTAPLGTQPGDIVVILLGFHQVLVLRPNDGETFQVVGPANVHGLLDAQGLLGPVPEPWVIKIERPGDIWRFYNTETGELSPLDPRLGPVSSGWTMLDDSKFRNEESGEITWVDPRCDPESLRARGLELRDFDMV